MKKKLKLFAVTVLALSLTAGLLTGCSKKEKAKSSADLGTPTLKAGETFHAKKPITITMLYNDNPAYPLKKDWLLWDEIKKRTNVTIKLTTVPLSDYEQKRSLLISTGDAPLIIPKTYPGSETAYIPSGAILPVSDYLKYMPNFEEKVEKWNMDSDLKSIKQANGKFYVLPGLHEKAKYDYSFAIRKDMLDKAGLKVPNSWDEIYSVLKVIKAKYPNIYPYSDRWKTDATTNFAAPTFGVSAGWGAGTGINYDATGDKFFFGPTTNDYKSFVTYFNKLIKDGLMDPESFTQSDDQAKQKFVNGKSFMIGSNTQETLVLQQTMEKNLGKGKFEILHMRNPEGPKGDVVSASRLENGVIISSKAKDNPNFKEIMEFVDWLWYSDEGQELTKWGVEGKTYNKSSDGVRTLAKGINFNNLSKNPSSNDKDLRKDFGFSGGVFSYGGSYELEDSMRNDLEKTFQKSMADKKVLPTAPPILYDEDEREQANMKDTPLMDYVKAQTLKFMLGSESLSNWDKYVAQCKAKGSEDLTKQANDIYRKTKDKLK
ncbi:extracellular solute-binding protein [Clostridium oryzae]|uniref:Lipoprotein LipO n=1 Tax=Clostridium oryzae TaxID=1450648 RepID=A0A1V4IHY0_9CLOT|nr:extracellular solute-binding protein [Clostridium oryzae]OPJ59275.1 lipoprotein LipO precursor [Clostridium oryzae]